ncbi:TetR family transcriptional regulator [Mycobacterium branderi]|uniref:TetR family transcriptional regulator n=1 Tax=Mycobacterium branderi TaxID=43348 RepID=A0A7I7W6A1_9MYCO|nr:TetR family transcriptional regulator [Mycobacterium branderi]MCV7230919.1 TetR family transcriptional regulator [Mycobacterium branderi]ORA38867.1 TetR family transcriptional regulator [Mycobacterium branderi]BBZ12211.1 putative transcriptional regulatory protein TetR [Mycobacterium branderi]
MPDKPVSLRDRQRAQVRDEIRLAAYRLFAEHGFDNVTTEQIAAAAGVSPSTFFRHIASKEELLLHQVRRGWEVIASLLEERPSAEPPDVALARAIEARTAAFQDDDTEQWRTAILAAPGLLEKITIAPEDKSRLVKLTAARMGTDPEKDTRPALLVHLAFAAADFGFQQWVRSSSGDHKPLLEMVSEALQAVMNPRWR